MVKKLLLSVVVGLLAVAQGLFVYALEHGAKEQFTSIWSSFGVPVSPYTRFVFRTSAWWWAAPAVSLGALGIAFYLRSRLAAAIAFALSLALVVALYWSAYAPNMLVNL